MSDGLAVRSTSSYLLKKVPVHRPDAAPLDKTPAPSHAPTNPSFQQVEPQHPDLLKSIFDAPKHQIPAPTTSNRIFPWDVARQQQQQPQQEPRRNTVKGPSSPNVKYSDWGVVNPPAFDTFDPTKLRHREPHAPPPLHNTNFQSHYQQPQQPYHPPHEQHQYLQPQPEATHPYHIHGGYTPRPIVPPAAPFPSPTYRPVATSRSGSEGASHAHLNGTPEPMRPSIHKHVHVQHVETPIRSAQPQPQQQVQPNDVPLDVSEVANILRAANVLPRREQRVGQFVRHDAGQPVGSGDPSPVEPLVTAAYPPTPGMYPTYQPPPPNTSAPVAFDVKQRFSDTERANINAEAMRFPAQSTLPLTEHKHPVQPLEITVPLRGDGKVGVTFNETPDGVFISGLVQGGNADRANVPTKGRIVSINGIQIRNVGDLAVAKEVSSVQAQLVVDTGVRGPREAKRDPEEGVGREVTALSDGDRLIRCVQAHPGLSCGTDDDVSSYLAIRGCRGFVTDQDLDDATVLVNFTGPELQAWLPLTAVIEYKLKPASQKLPSVAGRTDYSVSPEREAYAWNPPRKVEVRDPEIAAAGLPLVHPEDGGRADPLTDLKVVLSKYPEDKYFDRPVARRDYSPERAEQDMVERIDALTFQGEQGDTAASVELPVPHQDPQRAFFQYGFEPREPGIYLTENSPNEHRRHLNVDGLPSAADDPHRDNYLFPPPHYPTGLESDDDSAASPKSAAPSMFLDPEDEEYLQKLEIFLDEMEDYYKKAGPEEYKKFVGNMIEERTCPEELTGTFKKQLARMNEGKNPFKHRRRKPEGDTRNVAENPLDAVKKEEKVEENKKKKEEEKVEEEVPKPKEEKEKEKEKNKKEEEDNKVEEKKEEPKKKEDAMPKTEEVPDDEYLQKLEEFEEQMDTYYKAAGKNAYKVHLENLFKNSQVPPELTDDYKEQLELLEAGKDPTQSERRKQRKQDGKKPKKGPPKKKSSKKKKK